MAQEVEILPHGKYWPSHQMGYVRHSWQFRANLNGPVSQRFSPSGQQPKKRVLAHTSWQSTSGCIAFFTNIAALQKHGVIITNLTLRSHWVYITDMSKYHNTGYMEHELLVRDMPLGCLHLTDSSICIMFHLWAGHCSVWCCLCVQCFNRMMCSLLLSGSHPRKISDAFSCKFPFSCRNPCEIINSKLNHCLKTASHDFN